MRVTESGSAFNTKPRSVTFGKKAAPQAKTVQYQLQEGNRSKRALKINWQLSASDTTATAGTETSKRRTV